MHSELGYFACSLISRFNDRASIFFFLRFLVKALLTYLDAAIWSDWSAVVKPGDRRLGGTGDLEGQLDRLTNGNLQVV